MHVLITGGCGYVGSALTLEMLEKGFDVTVVDAQWFGNPLPSHPRLKVIELDVRNTAKIPLTGVESIIHLANIANDPCVDLDPKLSWEVNSLATMQLAEMATRSGVKQFIYASSGSVYGVKEEAQVTEDLIPEPLSEYNKTKMVSDRVVMSYRDQMAVQCIRPATICGFSPRTRLDLAVNMLTMQALTKGIITVLGGDQTRPNIHLKDMVGVYIHFLTKARQQSGIYNAGFENMSILELARLISSSIPTEIVTKESNDPRSYRLNSDRLLATGYKPQKTVKDGIQEITDAYRSGKLKDEDRAYNIRWMKQKHIAGA